MTGTAPFDEPPARATSIRREVLMFFLLKPRRPLEGRLKKLNFTNPHASIELTVPNKDGTFTEWKLTTASITTLTREGINKTSIKPGEILKVTILPARNGNPAGFIRNLQLGDRSIKLFFGDERD